MADPTAQTRVYVLQCGALGMDREQLIAAPKYRLTAEKKHAEREWIRCPLLSVVVDHPDGLLLWDCAASPHWKTHWSAELQSLMPYEFVDDQQYLHRRLEQLGYSTDDFDHVVLSHLHIDHAGNVDLFANGHTRIVVQEEELRSALDDPDYTHRDTFQSANMTTITGDLEILPGVTLLSVPGHTPGTMSLLVDLPNDGPVIFTSDAIYLSDSITARNWGTTVWDNRKWLASLDRLVALSETLGATLIFGHDAEQIKTIRMAPEYYS